MAHLPNMLLAVLLWIQAPLDTAARLDSVVRHAVRIGRTRGESIWPGFRPDTIPLALVLPGRGSFLFNWRGALPGGYLPLKGISGAGWRDERALGAASTAVELQGKSVAQVVVGSLDPAELLPTAFHEAFHAFERASVRPNRKFGRGENSFYVSSYPVFALSNEALFRLEGRLLSAALAAPTAARRRELAREFVAVRRARHRELAVEFAEFDRMSELNEGLAEYALVRALELLRDDRVAPAAWRSSARHQLDRRVERLARLTEDVAQSFRLRFYSTGPAQAQLLDALAEPGWKSRLVAQDQYLDDALAQAAGDEAGAAGAVARAAAAFDTSEARRQASAGIARLQALRRAQVDSLLAQPGVLLELVASALPGKDFGFCAFDPQNHLQVSATMQVQTRWWRPCAGAALTSEFNVPSVHDGANGTVRAVIGPDSAVTLTVGGKTLHLEQGQTLADAEDVRLDSPRATVQARKATLTREGRTLRITPLP